MKGQSFTRHWPGDQRLGIGTDAIFDYGFVAGEYGALEPPEIGFGGITHFTGNTATDVVSLQLSTNAPIPGESNIFCTLQDFGAFVLEAAGSGEYNTTNGPLAAFLASNYPGQKRIWINIRARGF